MSAAQKADALGFAIMEHLGPAALTGGKMSVYDAFVLGWNAALEAEIVQEVEPVAIAECKVVHGHPCQFLNRTPYGMQVLKDGDKLFTAPQAVNASMFQALQDIASGTYDTWTEGYRAQQIAVAALQKAERAKP